MNYYERHIGDYLKDTAHLSLLEHGIYARLLDVYYTRERGIPADQAARLIGARTADELAAIETVLSEFFVREGDVWLQARCERELERYRDKATKAKASAAASVAARRQAARLASEALERLADAERTLSERSTDAERTLTERLAPSNQSPVTNIKTSEPDGSGVPPVDKSPEDLAKQELWAAGSSLMASQGIPPRQARSIVGKLAKDYGNEVALEAVRAAVLERPVDAVSYIKATCQRMKGERKDPVTVASDAAEKTAAYLESQKMSDEDRARADEARKRALASIRRVA